VVYAFGLKWRRPSKARSIPGPDLNRSRPTGTEGRLASTICCAISSVIGMGSCTPYGFASWPALGLAHGSIRGSTLPNHIGA
jgi:hypothetical protein